MRHRRLTWRTINTGLLIAWFGLGAGCYPDEPAALDGLQLPLSQWGVSLTTRDLDSWLDYLETFDATLSPAFELSSEGQGFFLRLALEGGQEPGILGQSVNLMQEFGQEMLLVDLAMEDCANCRIHALVFFIESDPDQPGAFRTVTFAGSTPDFDYPTDALNDLQMDAFEEPTGRVVVEAQAGSLESGARAAALLAEENIRFPVEVFTAGQSGELQAVLGDLSIGRDFDIQLDEAGDGTWNTLARVRLMTEGQHIDVEVP